MNAAVRPVARLAPAVSRLRVKPADPGFVDAVMADLLAIRAAPCGRALFRRLRDTCEIVTIEKPDPPVDPPNAWTRLRDPANRSAREVVIVYDPADWANPALLAALPSDAVLFGRLADAAAMAEGGAVTAEAGDTVAPAIAVYLRDRRAAAMTPALPASTTDRRS